MLLISVHIDTSYSEKMKLLKIPVCKLIFRKRFGEIMENVCVAVNSYLHEYDKFSQVITFFAETSSCYNTQ